MLIGFQAKIGPTKVNVELLNNRVQVTPEVSYHNMEQTTLAIAKSMQSLAQLYISERGG